MEQIVGFREAVEAVQAATPGTPAPVAETVALAQADGRVLAAAVLADRDQPPFDRSTRDGFAVLSTAKATSNSRRICGVVRAGEVWTGGPLAAAEAIEIMTGAPLPEGTDAVVMVEHVTVADDQVTYPGERSPVPGQNVVARGSELRAGAVALQPGERLRAGELAVAAAVGAAQLSVWRRPRVAVMATGDELVEVAEVPSAVQIRNSNSYALAALVRAAGGEPQRFPITRDSLDALRISLDEALRSSDLLLFSGGVSAGKFDFVEQALAERGARTSFTGVRMQPGKPVVFGEVPTATGALPFFGLPGNPISTQVTFRCLVEPLLRRLAGERQTAPRFTLAALAHAVEGRPGLTRVLPARLGGDWLRPTVALVPWQGSGDQTANSRGDCYAVFAEGCSGFAAGDLVPVLLR